MSRPGEIAGTGSTTAAAGLTSAAAAARLREEGPNELPSAKPKGPFQIVLETFREPMFVLLVVTGLVYLVLGETQEAIALMGAIAVVIGITVYQEFKTERTLQALRDLSSPRALVVRDGHKQRIPGRDVVRGDLLLLSEGDRVPADAAILSSINLTVDESLLTGESAPVRKNIWDGHSALGRPGGDDTPAVYSGTLIVQGSATASVVATGLTTEIGKLGKSLLQIETESTNLERETRHLVRWFASISAVLCLIVAVVYGYSQKDWLRGALAGLALAISMVPEELPVVLTVFLALGAWRISKKRVLTRRVAAIEMLGSATVLCVDKTGTLTQNRMAVRTVEPADEVDRAVVLRAAVWASAPDPVDPMERALLEASGPQSGKAQVLLKQYPLTNDLLAMSHIVDGGENEDLGVYCKGAPEAVLQLCRVSDESGRSLLAQAGVMARQGLRVLGVAESRLSRGAEVPATQRDFRYSFLGLIGFEDPIRPTVPAAVKECHTAGIRVVMITGDYPATALSIGSQIGLGTAPQTLTGQELQSLSEEQLRERVRTTVIFARVLPEQKLRLVQALKANGEIVAMTGDGVNDAPALKAAHIGIAMGGRGTDVAREAASLVLLDDDFSSIVAAIRLGRRIYDNLREAMIYVFAIHAPIAGLSLIPVLLGLPLVLFPLHIVFLELVIDPACSVAFESEAEDPRIMERRPRPAGSKMFNREAALLSLAQGVGLLLVTIAAYIVGLRRGLSELDARAITFTTLVIGNITLIWANRSRSRSLFEMIRSRNLPLWAVTAGAVLLLAAVLYIPSLQALFKLAPLHADDLLVCAGLGISSLLWFETSKWITREQT